MSNDFVISPDQLISQDDKMTVEIIQGREYKVPLPSCPENQLNAGSSSSTEQSPAALVVSASETILSQEMAKSKYGSDYDNIGSILQKQKEGMYANSAA